MLDRREGYELSDDPDRLDLPLIAGFLSTAYWSAGRTAEAVERSIERSHAVGVYRGDTQVAFCRLVTDDVVFGYLADVFVVEHHRGRGLARWMVEALQDDHAHIKRILLGTADAHGVYAESGFTTLSAPERWMEWRGSGS